MELWLHPGRNSARAALARSSLLGGALHRRDRAAAVEGDLRHSRSAGRGKLAPRKPHFAPVLLARDESGICVIEYLKTVRKSLSFQPLSTLVPDASDDCLQLLEGLLHLNLSERLNAADALRCDWFTRAQQRNYDEPVARRPRL